MKNSDSLNIVNPIYPSPVFIANMKATAPVVGNQGGTWSGKTFSIIQALFLLTKSTKYYNESGLREPIITTIVGQDVPNLKKGAINDFNQVADLIISSFPDAARHRFKYTYNKTDKVCTFTDGSKIEFSSFKDWQDAKSGKRHFLFINEANGIPWRVAEQLMFRAKIRTFVDYNPDAPFWFHHRFIGRDGTKMIYSNFTHNKFTPKKVIRELIAKGKRDKEFKKVYILGKTGKAEGLVFPNIKWVSSMPKVFKRESYGMDFGYNDPTTLVRTVLTEDGLYMECLLYESFLTAPDIVKRFQMLGLDHLLRMYADSASPRTIRELNNLGYKKIRGARKGQDSIVNGIKNIKSYGTIFIVENMYWQEEQMKYKWQEDKTTGQLDDKPIDEFNHIWDADRYSMEGINKKTYGSESA